MTGRTQEYRFWPVDVARMPLVTMIQIVAWARRAKPGDSAQFGMGDGVVRVHLGLHEQVRVLDLEARDA